MRTNRGNNWERKKKRICILNLRLYTHIDHTNVTRIVASIAARAPNAKFPNIENKNKRKRVRNMASLHDIKGEKEYNETNYSAINTPNQPQLPKAMNTNYQHTHTHTHKYIQTFKTHTHRALTINSAVRQQPAQPRIRWISWIFRIHSIRYPLLSAKIFAPQPFAMQHRK